MFIFGQNVDNRVGFLFYEHTKNNRTQKLTNLLLRTIDRERKSEKKNVGDKNKIRLKKRKSPPQICLLPLYKTRIFKSNPTYQSVMLLLLSLLLFCVIRKSNKTRILTILSPNCFCFFFV